MESMDEFNGAGSAMGGGLGGDRMAEYAQLAKKPAQYGGPCNAGVRSIDETGNQYLPEGGESTYQPDGGFQAKADPDDPTKLLLFGQA